MLDQWCMVVIRLVPCTQICDGTETPTMVEFVVAVFGPYGQVEANRRTNQFNQGNSDPSDIEPIDIPRYEPVRNAPDFINQKNWDKHFARCRPMNHIPR